MKVLQSIFLLVLALDAIAAYRLPNYGEDSGLTDVGEKLLGRIEHKNEKESAEENESFTQVTNKEQLWRFMVGEGNTLTVGDRYICLRSYKDNYLYAYSSVFAGNNNCYKSSRFEVEFVEENKVTLKSHSQNRYISCSEDGSVRVTDWKDDSALFELRINEEENKLILFNSAVYGALTVTSSRRIDCNGYESDDGAKFSGWKLGPREAWEASEEWRLIAVFDNRYSSSATEYAYTTSVGIKRARNTEAAVESDTSAVPGPDMYDTFVKSIGPDADVAWELTPPNVWDRPVSLDASTEVRPHTKTAIYQAVGHYGIFTIFTNYIQARDDEGQTQTFNLLEA